MYHLHNTLCWKSCTAIGINFTKWKLWRICVENYTEKKFSEPVKSMGKVCICWPTVLYSFMSISSFQWQNNIAGQNDLFNTQEIENFPFVWQLKYPQNNLLSDALPS